MPGCLTGKQCASHSEPSVPFVSGGSWAPFSSAVKELYLGGGLGGLLGRCWGCWWWTGLVYGPLAAADVKLAPSSPPADHPYVGRGGGDPGKGKGKFMESLRGVRGTGGVGRGPGSPWLSPAVGDALPSSLSQQTLLFLGVVRGARTPASERRLLPHRWNEAAQNCLPAFPRPGGVSCLGRGLDQVTPGGPLRKKLGLWLWVGPVASSGSPASGSHQARGGGVAGEGRGGEPASSRPHTGPPLGSSGVGPTAPLLALSPANASQPAVSSPSTGCLSCEMRSHNMQ